MANTDRIIEFLHYNPGVSRSQLMTKLDLGVKDTQVKGLLGACVREGLVRTEGKARAVRYFITPKAQLLRTIDLDSYYAVADRAVQTSYNFKLIREELLEIDILSSDCRFAHFGVTLVGTVVGLAWKLLCRVVPIALVCAAGLAAVVGVVWLIGRVARALGGR